MVSRYSSASSWVNLFPVDNYLIITWQCHEGGYFYKEKSQLHFRTKVWSSLYFVEIWWLTWGADWLAELWKSEPAGALVVLIEKLGTLQQLGQHGLDPAGLPVVPEEVGQVGEAALEQRHYPHPDVVRVVALDQTVTEYYKEESGGWGVSAKSYSSRKSLSKLLWVTQSMGSPA